MTQGCACLECGLPFGSLVCEWGHCVSNAMAGIVKQTLRTLAGLSRSGILWRTPVKKFAKYLTLLLGHWLLLKVFEGSWLLDGNSADQIFHSDICWRRHGGCERWIRKGPCFCSGLSFGLFHGTADVHSFTGKGSPGASLATLRNGFKLSFLVWS